MRVGVEVGGTFTDLVGIDGDTIVINKVPSTPAAPDDGALAALETANISLPGIEDLVHGSTVATNAILERRGARVAFFVTKGFRDLLLLQRHNRSRIYDLFYAKPRPVVRRRDCFEIPERVDAAGRAIEALDEAASRAVIEAALRGGEYEAVAICLLNAFANPAHERQVEAIIRAAYPTLSVTVSCDVSGEFREYERASTTTLAAYVQPVIDRYLTRFEAALAQRAFSGRFSIMQSNGGRLPRDGMARNAITSLFSGPAAGVVGALRQAELSGFKNLITLDMGGTSTDVCLISDGEPRIAPETEVDGLPIRTPVVDIVSVGAGGGSILWRDDGGLLRVGPQSAGADPGPVCYGRGGQQPTITDCHIVRGSLRADAFLGGRMRVDGEAAADALRPLAGELDIAIEALADSAIRVADSNIVGAMQLVSTERGHDPRDYTLVPFGGAGPLHACRVAEALGMASLCVPPNAGVLSAFGLVAANFARYETRTRRVGVDANAPNAVRAIFADLAEEARTRFRGWRIEETPDFTHSLEMRYVGQAFEVSVSFAADEIARLDVDLLLQRFAEAHARIFAFGSASHGAAEIVSFRLGCSVPPSRVPTLGQANGTAAGGDGEIGLHDQGETIACPYRHRDGLRVDEALRGPLLIEDATSTLYIPATWAGHLDGHANLILSQDR